MLPEATKQLALEAIAGAISHVSVHSSYDLTGASELAVTRQGVTFGAFANGQIPFGSAPVVPDVPGGATARFWGLHSADTPTEDDLVVLIPNGSQNVVPFAALATGDVFHAKGHPFTDGQKVVALGSGLPPEITQGAGFYVVNAAADSFQLSATQGGAAVDLSEDGFGIVTQFVEETFGAQGSISLTSGGLSANLLGL